MPIDYSKYPPNWKTEIVPRILRRAGNCCENCGIENKTFVYSVPLAIRVEGKYKIKRIWTTDESCVKRLETQVAIEFEIKKVRVVLTIAHLDHDEHNHQVSDDRLAAWCQSCHLNYDSKEKQRRINNKSKGE